MKGSCRFAMALHVLTVLAYKEGDRVNSSLLAASVNTNAVVIRRLLLALKGAKLVETCKGAGAGSRLSRSPKGITLAQVYRAVADTAPFNSPSRKPNSGCPVGACMRAVLENVFASAEQALEEDLEKRTIADLVEGVKSCAILAKKPV